MTINRLKDPRDLWLFLQILFTLVTLPRLIRHQGLPQLLEKMDPGVAPVRQDRALLAKTTGFTDSLLKYSIFHSYGRCMLRSLILFKYLRRQGWPVEIHFGIRKINQTDVQTGTETAAAKGDQIDITGHSWLVLNGKTFLEAEPVNEYATTYTYPITTDR